MVVLHSLPLNSLTFSFILERSVRRNPVLQNELPIPASPHCILLSPSNAGSDVSSSGLRNVNKLHFIFKYILPFFVGTSFSYLKMLEDSQASQNGKDTLTIKQCKGHLQIYDKKG